MSQEEKELLGAIVKGMVVLLAELNAQQILVKSILASMPGLHPAQMSALQLQDTRTREDLEKVAVDLVPWLIEKLGIWIKGELPAHPDAAALCEDLTEFVNRAAANKENRQGVAGRDAEWLKQALAFLDTKDRFR